MQVKLQPLFPSSDYRQGATQDLGPSPPPVARIAIPALQEQLTRVGDSVMLRLRSGELEKPLSLVFHSTRGRRFGRPGTEERPDPRGK